MAPFIGQVLLIDVLFLALVDYKKLAGVWKVVILFTMSEEQQHECTTLKGVGGSGWPPEEMMKMKVSPVVVPLSILAHGLLMEKDVNAGAEKEIRETREAMATGPSCLAITGTGLDKSRLQELAIAIMGVHNTMPGHPERFDRLVDMVGIVSDPDGELVLLFLPKEGRDIAPISVPMQGVCACFMGGKTKGSTGKQWAVTVLGIAAMKRTPAE